MAFQTLKVLCLQLRLLLEPSFAKQEMDLREILFAQLASVLSENPELENADMII